MCYVLLTILNGFAFSVGFRPLGGDQQEGLPRRVAEEREMGMFDTLGGACACTGHGCIVRT